MTALDLALLAARTLLASVFLVAGVAKLFDRAGSRRALGDFGVPDQLARRLDVSLPITECVVAAALLPSGMAWAGSVGALSLLTLFTLVIGVSLAKGRRPDCHCFGQIHSAPIGWSTLTRNVILGCMAASVVVRGRDSAHASFADLFRALVDSQALIAFSVLLGAGSLLAAVVLLFQVIRQQGRILLRLESIEIRLPAANPESTGANGPPLLGLPVGTSAPNFGLKQLGGGESGLESFLSRRKPVLLFFTNPHCGPCTSLLADIARWHQRSGQAMSIVLISEGTAADNHLKTPAGFGPPVLLQEKREVAEAYQAHGTPALVLVKPDGTIGSPLVMGAEQVRTMAMHIIERSGGELNGSSRRGSATVVAVKLGDMAPPLQLQDLSGRDIPLQDVLAGEPVLLLFWNPDCGFCQRMWDELKRWDAYPPPDGPRLVVISSGTTEQKRAMRLRSPVMSDPHSLASSAFGAHGTPMAVLLDSQGRVASNVAAGREAVLALAGIDADGPSGRPPSWIDGSEIQLLTRQEA